MRGLLPVSAVLVAAVASVVGALPRRARGRPHGPLASSFSGRVDNAWQLGATMHSPYVSSRRGVGTVVERTVKRRREFLELVSFHRV